MGLTDMMGGGAYSGIVGGAMSLLSGILGGQNKAPELSQAHLDPITKGQTDFLSQEKYLPGVSQTVQEGNDLSTEMFKKNIAQFAPDVEQTNRQIGSNAADMLAGNVPLGTGGGFNGRDLSARDLGITSDDLMTSGVGMAGSALEGARSLNPFNHGATETLLTPGALLARDDSHKYELNDIANQQAQIKAKADSINPWMSALSSGAGSILGGLFKSQRGGG